MKLIQLKLLIRLKNVRQESYHCIIIQKKKQMRNDYSNNELLINTEKKCFELQIENHVAFVEFRLNNENILSLTHTEVPKALEGKGVGSAIVEKVLNYMQEQNYLLAPLCPFIAKYVIRHPEWKSILATGYDV